MTIEEKRNAIDEYCSSKYICTVGQEYPCPLHKFIDDCIPDDDEIVERNFALVSAMPDYTGQKEENNVRSVAKAMEVEKVLSEMVNHPSHYNQGVIECIDAMVSAFGKDAVAGFCIVNAFKYVWRASEKNGIEDIDKAIWYLNKFKELSGNV